MAAATLASLLIIASCLTAVSGLQCYSCSREDNSDALQYCALKSSALGNNTNVTCGSDETKCVISKKILENGNVFFFTRKCATSNFCSDVGCSRPDLKGTVICKSCCEGDLCNNGEGPTPSPTPIATPSGSSRIPLISDLYMFGSFLVCFLVYKVIMA